MTLRDEFERCWPWLAAALDRAGNTHGKEDLWQAIVTERAQFWPGMRCALVTEVVVYPKLKSVRYWLAGGEMPEILRMQEHIDQWARAQGCVRAEACGRLGWLKALKNWSGRMAVLTKEI